MNIVFKERVESDTAFIISSQGEYCRNKNNESITETRDEIELLSQHRQQTKREQRIHQLGSNREVKMTKYSMAKLKSKGAFSLSFVSRSWDKISKIRI